MDNQFFTEQREQSIIKARIVSKYFSAWARVIRNTQRNYPNYKQQMAYIDLFAGPGRYDDQSKSTPLMVLETILANPDLTNRMITMFNDKDKENVKNLKTAIDQLEGVAFFFKQWGTWGSDGVKRNKKANGKTLDGQIIQMMPQLVSS